MERAERQHAFTGPFDQDEQLAVDPVEGGHPFSVGIEGGFTQPFTVHGALFDRIACRAPSRSGHP